MPRILPIPPRSLLSTVRPIVHPGEKVYIVRRTLVAALSRPCAGAVLVKVAA